MRRCLSEFNKYNDVLLYNQSTENSCKRKICLLINREDMGFFLKFIQKIENYTKLEVNRFDINVIIYLNFIEKHGIKI